MFAAWTSRRHGFSAFVTQMYLGCFSRGIPRGWAVIPSRGEQAGYAIPELFRSYLGVIPSYLISLATLDMFVSAKVLCLCAKVQRKSGLVAASGCAKVVRK